MKTNSPKQAHKERSTEKVAKSSPKRGAATKGKPMRACARSSVSNDPSPDPKSKRSQKARRDEARNTKREAAAELKAVRVKGANSHHNPPKSKSCAPGVVVYELTEEEAIVRERCEAAIGRASIPTLDEIAAKATELFEESLLTGKVEVSDGFGMRRELTEGALSDMFFSGEDSPWSYTPAKALFSKAACALVIENNPDLAEDLTKPYRYDERRKGKKKASEVIASDILGKSATRTAKRKAVEAVGFRRWLSFVSQNRRYRFAKPYADAVDAVQSFDLRSYSPPDAERQFILDVGPTNSGKTYSGMQELLDAESGVYLGPLRLLAMEAADSLNEMGCPCSLLTGEERSDVEGARHVASTVEMLDRGAHYDVAVIDECQMITDPERGYAWAAAITSVNADVVHLCLAPEAEVLVRSILEGLDEDYEIERHERLVPLEMQTKTVRYPSGIRRGDAVIVFSRKSVQRYVSDLAKHGISASMVYGALPYEVRKEEVRKFADGETDVVVATDAIGMGLNLPIKRVVFAELSKFDGHAVRELLESEVKQIAGRAGRYGKYDVGYVNVLRGQDKNLVKSGLESDIVPVAEIRVDMPSALYDIEDIPLSQLMRAWSMESIDHPYVKRNLQQQISLARRVEDLPNSFVLEAVEIPFKSGDRFVPLDSIWEHAVRRAYKGEKFYPELASISPMDSLQHFEDAAKLADLAYGLAQRYGTTEDMEEIDEHRRMISEYMIENLKGKGGSSDRTCHWCGAPLPKKSSHPMHDECYREWKRCKRNDNSYLVEEYVIGSGGSYEYSFAS